MVYWKYIDKSFFHQINHMYNLPHHILMEIWHRWNRVWRFGFETSRFRNFSICWMVSDSVSKKFGIEKSIGFGIGKIWYRKKYRIRYRKNLVSEKFRIRFRSDLGYRHTLINSRRIILNVWSAKQSQKMHWWYMDTVWFSFVQIWGTLGDDSDDRNHGHHNAGELVGLFGNPRSSNVTKLLKPLQQIILTIMMMMMMILM